MKAIAIIKEKNISGIVKFRQFHPEDKCRIYGKIIGISPGKHGFHIHEWGDLSDGCQSAGTHFNPFNRKHGGKYTKERHLGDLGNIISNEQGIAEFDFKVSLTLYGVNSIIGRSIVIHEKEDDLGKGGDLESHKTGNSGSRIACSVIGMAKP